MGLFGWGEQDDSTPQERAAWKERAEQQRKEQKRARLGIPATPPPEPGSKHRRARRPE